MERTDECSSFELTRYRVILGCQNSVKSSTAYETGFKTKLPSFFFLSEFFFSFEGGRAGGQRGRHLPEEADHRLGGRRRRRRLLVFRRHQFGVQRCRRQPHPHPKSLERFLFCLILLFFFVQGLTFFIGCSTAPLPLEVGDWRLETLNSYVGLG